MAADVLARYKGREICCTGAAPNAPTKLKSVSVQCPGLGEEGHGVAAVVGGDGVGEVGV
jgi:hypothetical protein